MSSTRKAKDTTVYHQNRFASSAEFERGLTANLVAKRCSILDDKADIELIWFIQWLSWQPGSLRAVAKELLEKYSARIMTAQMVEAGVKPGDVCRAETVRKLRDAFGFSRFPLEGEHVEIFVCSPVKNVYFDNEEKKGKALAAAAKHPASYPASDFFERCREAAESNDGGLEKYLRDMCLDPAIKLADGGPWYFVQLVAVLREIQNDWSKTKCAGIVTTALGAKVCEVLDYTAYSRGLTLMQGNARLGKTFAARAWCEQRPGLARFVEVPPSNDDSAFFRALARGLGLGNFLNYKTTDIRERVESVLLTGNILLVFDEAHRLWPQVNLRYGFPGRINWVMAMANQNVPICCIATPQFIEMQKAAAEKSRWNSAQLTGRIGHFEALPGVLSESDLQAVAKAVLPEADSKVLRMLAIYAGSSERYLAAIDSIAKRARYLAGRAGRREATSEDVRKAMSESVLPADKKLQTALEVGRKAGHVRGSAVATAKTSPPAIASEIESSERHEAFESVPHALVDVVSRVPGGRVKTYRVEQPSADLPESRRHAAAESLFKGVGK